MVQYSAPARPLMMRSTRSWLSQSGQVDRTPEALAFESCMSGLPLLLRPHRSPVEVVDAGLCVGDGRFRIGPGESDLKLGKRYAVDHDGLKVLAPDPGM